ncbi:hypothetical protein Pfo_026899 [Paulownia fortunei]|nr:hypothetical protein Pfo_026899 [Paulownia fortunei]
MEEAVVGATIQVVLQNLLSVSAEEISLFRDFKKDLKKLNESVSMIQDFLDDAEKKQVTDKAVKRWLKKLEGVAFDADNVLDELNYEDLSKKMETQNKMKKNKVPSFFPHRIPIARRLKMARKIRDINANLEKINKEASGFGLQVGLAGAHVPGAGSDAPAGMETDSFTLDPIFLGRENDVPTIVEMLTASPTEQVLSVIPIVGMGGLGKTTLARKVYGDEKIKAHFEKRIWVHVSKKFDPVILFKSILTSLTTENVEHGSREVLLKKLQEYLGAKRYLLALDDVWNEEKDTWENFKNSLSGISSTTGNSIIVTTRNGMVASIVKTLHIHELKSLSESNCESIIKAKAFGEGDILSEFETMSKNIAKRCQGLPLAANVVGGLLCNKSKDEWLSIEENWLSYFGGDGNNVLKILKLSYDNLSSASLKKCFAYCSIFRKGVRIQREELIELWMAEGFLQTDQRNDIQTIGNNFFNILLKNSLLQVVRKDSYDNITHCNMHDLVHDLASSVLGSKSIRVNDNVMDDICQVRYIGRESSSNESSPIPKGQARCLRTLFFKGKVSDDMFSDFNSLHVLTLVGDDIKELPSSIRKLIHLRYLDISYTRIECLPDSIGKLYHLQTLRAVRKFDWETNYLRFLPNTLKYLISLRHLHIPDIELPPEIGRLTSLQTLPYFQVGHEKGRGIAELGSLKNLKGQIEIHNLEMVHDKDEAKSADLSRKPNIFKLKFMWNESREGEANDENVLEGLQPHPNLKSLEIYGFRGRSFPSWTSKMAVRDKGLWEGLNNLMKIRLESCEKCEEIPMLGNLPHLKYLYLCDLMNVRSIGSSFYGIDNCSKSSSSNNGVFKETIIVFPALERLELFGLSNLTEWVEVELPTATDTQPCEVVVFPCLEYLEVIGCKQLMSAPRHFPCLQELEISRMDSGLPLANICGIKLTSLTKLRIEGLDGLVCLPEGLFCNNQNLSKLSIEVCPNLTHLVPCLGGGGASLRELKIWNCSNLRELPDDLHSLNSLEKLLVYKCPNLKSIPYPSRGQSQGFTSLRGLTNLPSEMVESCAPSLESLSLYELSSLTNLPMLIGCLQKMPRLTYLKIMKVPKFTISAVEIGSLRSLQELRMGYWSDSWDYVSFKETLDGILQGSHSLRILILYGMEHWDSLRDQLQHLTSLSTLLLDGFGMEALPEWIGNLSSLEELALLNCKKLKRLPSKEAMQRLTKLTNLNIINCPLLKERCIEEQSDDSEWPKISHILNVLADWEPISSHHRQ